MFKSHSQYVPELGFELIPKNEFLITAPYTFSLSSFDQSKLMHTNNVPYAILVLEIKRHCISLALYDEGIIIHHTCLQKAVLKKRETKTIMINVVIIMTGLCKGYCGSTKVEYQTQT